jgi:hypothetical protein
LQRFFGHRIFPFSAVFRLLTRANVVSNEQRPSFLKKAGECLYRYKAAEANYARLKQDGKEIIGICFCVGSSVAIFR